MELENGFREYSLDETYHRMMLILKHLCIEIEITVEQRLPYAYSSRVQLKKIPVFGTNGKGVTEKASIVSGLAEFFERLQSFALYKYRKPLSHIKSKKLFIYSPDEQLMDPESWRTDLQNCFEKHATLLSEAEKVNRQVLHIPYQSVFENKNVYLPVYATDLCYATNGLASGNTNQEASIQAVCEIFERYANKTILESGQALPTIPLQTVFKQDERLKAFYNGLLGLEECEVLFKDASLGLSLPVVMMIFIDHSIGRYFVKFASHPVFSVAVIRLLTELVQGRRIAARKLWLQDFSLKTDGNSSANYNIIMRSGDGQYPHVVFQHTRQSPDMSVWMPEKQATSSSMYKFLVAILKKNGWQLYVRELDFLGFPTCQAIIPGVSEIFQPNILAEEAKFFQMKQYFLEWDKLSVAQGKHLLTYIAEHVPPEKNLMNYFGFLTEKKAFCTQVSSMEFLIALSMKYELLEDAVCYIKRDYKGYNMTIKLLQHLLQVKLIEKAGGDGKGIMEALQVVYKQDSIQEAKRILEEPDSYLRKITCDGNFYDAELEKLHEKLQDCLSCKNGAAYEL